MLSLGLIFGLATAALFAEVAAPPSISQDGVRNAASQTPPGLPGGAIAPGSVFVIDGVRLAPAPDLSPAWLPGERLAAEISVAVTAGGVSRSAATLATSEDRIVAIMPSGVPAGPAQVTVAHSGQQSLPLAIQIAEASFGILTVNVPPDQPRLADFPAVVYHVTMPPSRPGQTLSVWGTGLGSSREVAVFLGGTPARVVKVEAGAGSSHLDRIDFVIPPLPRTGCAVPVQVQMMGTTSSNTVMIPVTKDGRPCSDAAHWLLDVSAGTRKSGLVVLARTDFFEDLDAAGPETSTFDLGMASFTQQAHMDWKEPVLPSLGTCTSYNATIPMHRLVAPPLPVEGRIETVTLSPAAPVELKKLDAGLGLRLQGPAGTRILPSDPRRGGYSSRLGGSLFPKYFKPGRWIVLGEGGTDVGAFAAKIPVPGDLRWTNREEIHEIRREDGVPLRWTPAADDQIVAIVAGALDAKSGATAWCVCMVPAMARQFTIPPQILANLPRTSASRDLPSSFLLLAALPGTAPRPFQAKGLDAGFAFYISMMARAVAYR